MDKKTFEHGMKLFKRFLKENGMYTPIIKFLFKNGRKQKHLFYEFNSERFTGVDDWRCVLSYINLMVGKGVDSYDKSDFYDNFDYDEYSKLINYTKLNDKWQVYYKKNHIMNNGID